METFDSERKTVVAISREEIFQYRNDDENFTTIKDNTIRTHVDELERQGKIKKIGTKAIPIAEPKSGDGRNCT